MSKKLIQNFYSSFQERDHEGMKACYHPDIEFTDPAFNLQGPEAGAMWHMLCEAGKDLKITFDQVEADESTGSCRWQAWYTFSATGRKVHNIISARFKFQDEKIIRHHDTFDFWRWSRMALGPAGWFLGWSSFLQKKVQAQARSRLKKFMAARSEY